jgi:hypothetical protein
MHFVIIPGTCRACWLNEPLGSYSSRAIQCKAYCACSHTCTCRDSGILGCKSAPRLKQPSGSTNTRAEVYKPSGSNQTAACELNQPVGSSSFRAELSAVSPCVTQPAHVLNLSTKPHVVLAIGSSGILWIQKPANISSIHFSDQHGLGH